MIGYINLGTNNIEAAVEFYDQLLKPLSASKVMVTENFVAWADKPGAPMISIIKPFNGEPATAGNGSMLALKVDSPKVVEEIYAIAIKLGGKCEGEPGNRSEQFYAAYFRDLDGNKLNAYCLKAS